MYRNVRTVLHAKEFIKTLTLHFFLVYYQDVIYPHHSRCHLVQSIHLHSHLYIHSVLHTPASDIFCVQKFQNFFSLARKKDVNFLEDREFVPIIQKLSRHSTIFNSKKRGIVKCEEINLPVLSLSCNDSGFPDRSSICFSV